MTSTNDQNQNPDYYSKDYYMNNCGGFEEFKAGKYYDYKTHQYLRKMAKGFAGKSVLDLGCGRGEMCYFALKDGAKEVIGLDFSKSAIEICTEIAQKLPKEEGQQIHFVEGNAIEKNLEKEFDVIILGDIVEHLYNDQLEGLFKNVHRHLKSDGIVVIHTMPTVEFIRYGQYIKALKNVLCFKRFPLESFESQRKVTHVNLQDKKNLSGLLKDFDYRVWYDFSNDSWLRSIIRSTPLIRYFCSNLWATAKKK